MGTFHKVDGDAAGTAALLHLKDGSFEVSFEGFSIGSTKMWEQAPLWNTIDEPMKGFRTAADNSRVFGHAGPPSAKATEVYSKYIIVDMFAKGVQGAKPDDAVTWAAGELKKIYG